MKNDERSLPIKILEENIKSDYIFRICIIGDANVGKTSILTRYCDNVFRDNYVNTIGVDFRVITMKQNEKVAKIHIWDTAGQERFKSISVNYFRNTHGFIYVYDVTNRQSLDNLSNWMKLANNVNKTSSINFLVGNKTDSDKRVIKTEEGREYADCKNMIFLETSALTNDKISYLFEYFADRLMDYYSKNKYQPIIEEKILNEKSLSVFEISAQKKKCC